MLKKYLEKYKRINVIYKDVELLLKRFEEHHIYLLSAGIAFNILLYMIPLFLLAVFVVNLIFPADLISATIVRVILEVMPPSTQVQDLVLAVIKEISTITEHSSVAGWIGIFILMWISSALFSSLRTGLNTVYYIPTPKIFILYRIKDMIVTLILSVLLLISYYVFPIISVISGVLGEKMPQVLGSFFSSFTIFFSSIISSLLFFYFLFRFIPNQKIPILPRLISTVLCVLFIEISRYIFAWYIGTISNMGKFYGTYAVIVSLALWVYYFTLIILISAEVGQLIYESMMKRRLIQHAEMNPDEIIYFGG